MRVLERRFLRGPNVHRRTPCLVAVLDFEGDGPVNLPADPIGTTLWLRLLPDAAMPVAGDTDGLARLLAQFVFATQAWAGVPAPFCEAVRLSPTAPHRYRLICDYQHEAVSEEALRAAVDLVAALSRQQPFDLAACLGRMRALAGNPGHDPGTQSLLRAACDRGIPAIPLEGTERGFALGWGTRRRQYVARHSELECPDEVLDKLFADGDEGRIPVIAVTGTNGKTTTTQLIAHVLRAGGAHTGTTTTQGIYIDRDCVKTGDCSGYWSARQVLNHPAVEVAVLETARGGILKRGLAFDRCDVGVVLNVSSDHLGLDGVETLQDLAHVKGLVVRCAALAAVLNAEDALCVAMRQTLLPGCAPVFFTMDPENPVFVEHLRAGGAGACFDDGWLVWCDADERSRVVRAADLPFTWQGHARYNTANALAALAALRSIGTETAVIGRAMQGFVSDARTNPLRGNQFEVDGIKLIVDYAHNVVAYRALCDTARSMLQRDARLLGVVTSPGDRRPVDLYETGQVCGLGFDELVIYEQDPRGRAAGATSRAILRGARSAAPDKPLHREPRIRHALWRGLMAARPGDVLVFACAGSFDDLVEGVRFRSPAAAARIAREVHGSVAQPTGTHETSCV